MSMLVPTLLQLSKTTGSNKNDDGRNSNLEGTGMLPKIGSKALDSTNNLTGLQQEGKSCATVDDEVKLQEKMESDRSLRQSEAPLQVPVTHDEPLHRIESILDQLAYRMDRIENCFLRFEQNMLKPINSIEGRLKQVEQQLEVLTKESHGSEWPSCFRMSAPSFSANESGSNSFYNSGNDNHPSCGPIEPDRKELHSGAAPTAVDISNSVGSSLLRPSLVVTAPEFSDNDDDDQENQVLEVAMDSSKSKPKPSIDDVLASALAQFTSSSSTIKTPECTKTVAISPPEFLDEDRNNYRKALSSDLSAIEIDHINCSQETDNTECTTNSASASLSSANGGNLSPSRHDHSSKISDGDDEQVLKSPECKYRSADGDVGVASAEQSVKGIEELGNVEVINETSEDCVPEMSDNPIHPLHRHPENGLDSTNADAMEVTKEGCDIDIVHDVLGFSCDRSVVDFEIPILDVSFTSAANSSSDDTLKDLLGDMPESNYGAPCLKESDDANPIGEQYDLILVEEEEQVSPTSRNGPISVDMNYYTIMGEPLNADGEDLQDYCNNTIISSLI